MPAISPTGAVQCDWHFLLAFGYLSQREYNQLCYLQRVSWLQGPEAALKIAAMFTAEAMEANHGSRV